MNPNPLNAEPGSGHDGENVTILLAFGEFEAPTVQHSPSMIALRDAAGEDVVIIAPDGTVRVRGVDGGVNERVYHNLARLIGWGKQYPCVGGVFSVQPGHAGIVALDGSPAGKNGEIRVRMDALADKMVVSIIPQKILTTHGDGTTTPSDPADVFANLMRLSDEMDRRWPPTETP